MPPRAIRLRGDVPSADATLVVRGGERSLSAEIVRDTAEANFEAFGFWALSSRDVVAIRRRRLVRTAECGHLRAAGFPLFDTTRHPLHFSVVLAELTVATFARLRSCFSGAMPNPGYDP